MPATLTIPAGASDYHGAPNSGAFQVFRDFPFDKPDEGYKRIPLSIDWGTDANASGAILFNLAGRVSEFTAIRGMYIDNTQCGTDIQIIFTDSQFEFTCAAGEKDYFQVMSSQLNFAIVATNKLSGDKTWVQLLNYAPRPLGNFKSVYSSAATTSALNLTGNSTNAIITSGNGTVTGYTLGVSGVLGGDATTSVVMQLIDGTLHVIWQAQLQGVAGGYTIPYVIVGSVNNINERFNTGLNLKITVSGTAFTAGIITETVFYRMP